MQVKGRIFPYPVLNNNHVFSGFKSESFSLNYEAVEDESNYTLKGLTFATESKTINSLFKEGKMTTTEGSISRLKNMILWRLMTASLSHFVTMKARTMSSSPYSLSLSTMT